MGKPLTTIQCYHQCPQSDGSKPHIGGPIMEGSSDVFSGSKSIARVGDKLQCSSSSIPKISSGSSSVYINGKAVAHLGSQTNHGGAIVEGNPSVVVN